jgi:hypothetical protein
MEGHHWPLELQRQFKQTLDSEQTLDCDRPTESVLCIKDRLASHTVLRWAGALHTKAGALHTMAGALHTMWCALHYGWCTLHYGKYQT